MITQRINAAFAANAGPRLWGVRDCISMAAELTEAMYTGRNKILNHPETVKARATTEARATARAAKKYRSTYGAYKQVLQDAGWRKMPDEEQPQPGDIIFLGGFVEVDGLEHDADKLGALPGFVATTHEVFVWAPGGLRVPSYRPDPEFGFVDMTTEGLFRCQA